LLAVKCIHNDFPVVMIDVVSELTV